MIVVVLPWTLLTLTCLSNVRSGQIALYLVLIFAEIIPVVRQGLPFNVLNPLLGFAITFAMFFDDSVAEALAMWIIEGMFHFCRPDCVFAFVLGTRLTLSQISFSMPKNNQYLAQPWQCFSSSWCIELDVKSLTNKPKESKKQPKIYRTSRKVNA